MIASHARRLVLSVVASSLVVASPCVTSARAGSDASLRFFGNVSAEDGTPIQRAVVTIHAAAGDRTTMTDASGRFTIGELKAGIYGVDVRAAGYDALIGQTAGLRASVAVAFVLSKSVSSLITIGRTQARAGNTLSTSTVPTTTIATQTYAARGYTRVSDVLQDDISTTLVHPLGGGSSVLPTSVALRGPDPTETLVDIDGHQVNSGNTGDFDLSLLDPADLANVELVKGISPSSLIAPDTIDGAINVRTLEPTLKPHALARFYGGGYNAFGETLQSTGSYDRVGYAFSLHRTTNAGEVNQTISDLNADGTPAHVGSAIDASSLLAKLRYGFGRSNDAYVEVSLRDQTQFRDLSAALTTIPDANDPDLSFAMRRVALGSRIFDDSTPVANGFEGTTLLAHNAGYGVDVSVPFGLASPSGIRPYDALYRHYSSYVAQSVDGPGADISPYLYNDRDRIDDETLQLDRYFSRGSVTLRYDVLSEALDTDFAGGVVNDESVVRGTSQRDAVASDDASDTQTNTRVALGQTQRFLALRGTYDPTAALHLTAAGYYSRYSIFGSSLDPRFGVSFTPDALSVVRFSLGTTYQPPNLPELYVAPNLPTVVGQAIAIGNPNLRPDRATEYGLGFEHVFDQGARHTSASIDVYRVNLRSPAATLVPDVPANCGTPTGPACPFTMTVNAGDAVYQGVELEAARTIAPATTLRLGYAVRSSKLTNVPSEIQDGSLVVGEQSLGLPLQKGTIDLEHAPPTGLTYSAGLTYEGLYNELNQPQYATVRGSIGYRLASYDLDLSGTNLSNVYDQRFTHLGAGLTYGGTMGPIATNAYALQGASFTLSLTRRF